MEELREGQAKSSAKLQEELTDKIEDETLNRNQVLGVVRNAAESSQKAAAEAAKGVGDEAATRAAAVDKVQADVEALRKDLKGVAAKIPAKTPESAPGD